MQLRMVIGWVFATPLNVAGAPGDSLLVDTPLLREYTAHWGAQIILPASTIKGKVRNEAERLLRTWGWQASLCRPPRAENMCPAYWWDRGNPPSNGLCPLCSLFGSPAKGAPLYFTDAGSLLSTRDTTIRPGVGLSRVRGTAQEDLLFFVETTPPGEEVTFTNSRVEGEVPDARSAALLWAAVQQVAAYGNGRSRGRGWLQPTRVRIQECVVDGIPWGIEEVREALPQWINPNR